MAKSSTNRKPGMLARLYAGASLFALLNLVGIVAVGIYAFVSGSVDAKKLRDIGRVLRGEPAFVAASPAPAAPSTSQKPAAPKSATAPGLDNESEERLEIAHRESERIRTELEQRLALANSVLFKLREERDAFREEREAAAARDKAVAEEQRTAGFQRQVALFESLAPKVALDQLLGISDTDDAARTLSAISTSKARRIVEAAKRGVEAERMKLILQRMRDVAPTTVADLRTSEP